MRMRLPVSVSSSRASCASTRSVAPPDPMRCPSGIGNDEEARLSGQQIRRAPPFQLPAIHVGLAFIAGRQDAHIPAELGVGLERCQVLLPVVAIGLLQESRRGSDQTWIQIRCMECAPEYSMVALKRQRPIGCCSSLRRFDFHPLSSTIAPTLSSSGDGDASRPRQPASARQAKTHPPARRQHQAQEVPRTRP